MSPTIYKRATGAGSFNTLRAVYYRDKLTNHVIRAESAAEAETEFAIRQDILIRGSEVKEESLFINEMPIEILIAIKDSKNRLNEESELDDSVYINKATAGDKTLKDA